VARSRWTRPVTPRCSSKEAFEVREGQRTTFVADFTPVKRGQTGTYLFQPVASGTEVRYEDVTETESGE